MSATRKITVEMPEELAVRLAAQTHEAGYESENALVVESLETYLDHSRYDGSNPEIEMWLREQVLPTYERWKSEGTRGIPAEDILGRLKSRRMARGPAV